MTDEQKAFEELEQRLNGRKVEYNAIPVPDAAVHQSVQTGIRQAARRRRSRVRWYMSSISTAAIILLFTGCIRVSPAFASFVEQWPGMEGIVSMIRQDKGLQMAIDQSLLQKVGITDEHDGASVTIDGIITDESRMVIFYTMKGMKALEKGEYDIDLLDENGKNLPVAFSYFSPGEISDMNIYENYIDVIFTDEASPPEELSVVFKPRDKAQSGEWKVTLPVDKNLTKGMKKVLPVNQTLTVDGQRIEVKQATLYPTRLVLDVTFDPKNTKKVFGLSDLQLVDEQGRAWRTDTTMGGDDERSIYFESMYFSIPKKLTLQGSGLSGLEKDELDFTLNLESGRITGGPSTIKFMGSEVVGKDRILEFSVPDINGGFTLAFTEIKDEVGKTYEVPSSSWRTEDVDSSGITSVHSTVENGAKMKGDLQMKLSTYPMKVKAPFSLEIPLDN
ncbi:DUF4179 domain-containing protein [Paenibacillus xylanilyticus]|uniref:DUF4179 domain-containing protein n=1 Tax=Paenibacillus xylanilyticus TaxID=248903 RepID=A0A7Y6EVY1_9BACL|nr:DUF4179 domain-containing protein [Paenibacillus xylanilyticus]NUU78757.1 DUF4179 domain-containing protein [Paenibacillus xylanilyticus]